MTSSTNNAAERGAASAASPGPLKSFVRNLRRPEAFILAAVLLYPLVPALENKLFAWTEVSLGEELTNIFIYTILALGLNAVVGYAGLLQLGIAAFFGIGAYVTGVLTVPAYPFQTGFCVALVASTGIAALAGLVLAAPTLRLRGDYLAIVTLGFGEVVRYSLRNFEQITAGTRGLNPVPSPQPPEAAIGLLRRVGIEIDWMNDYRPFYFLTLGLLIGVLLMLRNLERSRLGRAWNAVREDELAASCMGVKTTRAKMAAFSLGAGLAGMAGCLYATALRSTADPNAYDFNRSMITLCCIIVGGLGSLRGTVLGVFLIIGFDNIVAPTLDGWLQHSSIVERLQTALQDSRLNLSAAQVQSWLTFSTWRMMIFGLALIVVIRFKPHGLLPARARDE